MFFYTSWKDLRKHCWIVSVEALKIWSHGPKNTLNVCEKSTKIHLHTKKGNWRFFRRSFSQSLKVCSSKYKIEKKPSPSEKSTKTLFCTRVLLCWENCRIFFCSILDKKCSGSSKKILVTKKKQERSLPRLEYTFGNTVENCSAEARTFKLTVQKNPNLYEKNSKLSSEWENWNTETFVGEVSLKVWTFSARSTWLKKRFI